MRRTKSADPSRRSHRRSPSATDYSALESRRLLFGDLDFAHQLGDQIDGLARDSAGNLYLAGTFEGTSDFDPGPGAFNMTSPGGSLSTFVVKLDAAGNFLWARQIAAESLGNLVIDPNDNLYLCGDFSGTVDFDPGPGTVNLTSIVGSKDAWISRWTTEGALVWVRQIGGDDHDSFEELALDTLGNVYAAGILSSLTIDMDPGPGTATHNNAGGDDGMVLKLDSAGNHLWSDTMGGTDDDLIAGLAVDRYGSIFLAGSFMGTTDLDPTGGVQQRVSAGSNDAFLAKWDVNGNFVWGHSWGGTSSDSIHALVLSPEGLVYVSGGYSGLNVDFDPGLGTEIKSTNSISDAWISSFDDQGNFRWVRTYSPGIFNVGSGWGLALDDVGNVYLGGVFDGYIDFDHGPETFGLSAPSPAGFVVILDENGGFRWALFMQSNTPTGFVRSSKMRIVVDSDHNVFLTGTFGGTVDFDTGPGFRNLTSNGTYDGFLVKLTNDFLVGVPLTGAADYVIRKNGDLIEVYDDALNVVVDSRMLDEIEGIEIRGADGFVDRLTIDFESGGSFGLRNGIRFHAGTGAGDILRVAGAGNGEFQYLPSATAGGESVFTKQTGDIRITGVESAVVDGLEQLTVTTPNSQDVLTLAAATGLNSASATRISGTSGGVPFVPVTVSNIIAILIGMATSDTVGPSSNDTVTVNAGALQAAGLRDFEISLGRGADVVYTNDADLGLPLSGGQFLVRGGAGVDRVSVTGNADWWINDARVASSSGGQINFDGIERATVIAGAGNNTITAVGFFGPMILQGLDGNDTIWGGSYADTISGGNGNDNLYGMDGDDSLDGQANADRLFGGNGNDTLNGAGDNDWLFGGDGDDVLRGGLGIDILNGQNGNDTLNGEGGLDLFWFEGTNSAEVLHLQFIDAANARHVRRPRGLSVELERDTITMDSTDQFFIQALDGDDLITIDLGFTNLGSVDGGNGLDACTAPASWTKTSCP